MLLQYNLVIGMVLQWTIVIENVITVERSNIRCYYSRAY